MRGRRLRHRERMFFFFQAEDGIRDVAVTGVQTCALPILETLRTYRWPVEEPPGAPPVPNGPVGGRRPLDAGAAVSPAAPNANVLVTRKFEIGRASCRERV